MSDSLNDFIDARQRGERPAHTDADTAFAAALLDTIARTEPSEAFMNALNAQFLSPTPSRTPVAAMPGLNGRQAAPTRRRQPAVLTWAAVLATVLLLGALVLALGQPDSVRVPAAIQSSTATPTPDPTPTPEPAAIVNPLPVLAGGYARADGATFERMYDAGLRWAGLSLEYRAGEEQAILAEAQAYIEAARAAGLGVMVSLYGSGEQIVAAQPDDFATIAEFSGELAALGPMAIEVWPEANLDLRWPVGKIGGASYAELLRPVYAAVKSVNPNVVVISGAPAPTSAEVAFPGRVVNDDNFYHGMAAAGLENFADCIGVHYVEGVLSPLATSGDPRDDHATRYLVPMLHRAAEHFRDTLLPLCLTELGYISPEGLPEPFDPYFAWASDNTAAEQAEWLAAAIETVARLSSVRTALVMIYRIDPLPDDLISSGYAIIRPDGSCATCDNIAKLQS